MATPRLFLDLRIALKCLYSLSSDQVTSHSDSQKAHDFLLHIQTRNVRRKLHSIQQSARDQRNKSKNNSQEDVSRSSQLVDEVDGSTWLACLATLCCDNADSAERLFAAQTLMHRLRRSKLSEAIDLEMEDPNRYLSSDLNVNLHLLATEYHSWLNHFHPNLGMLVLHYLAEHVITDDTNEEQLKGELTILTLAAITYLTASHAQKGGHHVQPLVCTLGNCLATTALRLRYTPQSVSMQSDNINGNKATSFSVPIVTMILHSLLTSAAALDPNKENTSALFQCQCSCLGVIPEALLSSGGGAMGRISIDPKCIQAVHEELRQPSTGVYLWFEALGNCNLNDDIVRSSLLDTCQKWAKSLPLPQDFIDHTVPLAGQLLISPCTPQAKAAALAYLCAIFEVGAWTADFILTHSLGLSSEQLSPQPSNKKKQSSRSKRRQKERIDSTATEDSRDSALAECRHRGEMACRTTRLIWEGLAMNVRHALTQSVDVGGEGPVGCLTACANACLPHWLRYSSSSEDAALVVSVLEMVQEVASHSDRSVRALSYEPIFTLSSVLSEVARARYSHVPSQQLTELESIVANHLFQCTMRLATSCEYPPAYFMKMNEDNDEEIEIERNDVRDLIRAVCGCEGDVARGKTSIPMDVSVGILRRIIQSCSQACNTGASLPPETAVHALSALAKPLNVLTEGYATCNSYRCEGTLEILVTPIRTLESVHKIIIASFETLPVIEIFPVSRLANLASAAFAPALSALCKLEASSDEMDRALSEAAWKTVDASVHAAALSVVHIPELTAESTLDHSPFDIRGAFRGPGGEDHVGCLALSRLAFESDELARTMVNSSPSLGLELCKLHNELKTIENERPRETSHGQGVAAKSRRILVNTICRIVQMDSSLGHQEASVVLQGLFYSLVVSTAELSSSPTAIDAERMYRICEQVLDLSAFSPILISEIFNDIGSEHGMARDQFLSGLVDMCRYGYLYSSAEHDDDMIIQWNRLRGALVSLFRSAACRLPSKGFDAIVLLNQCECQAIVSQCTLGPLSTSPIFNESVISESSIPSGIFIHLLGDIIKQQSKGIIALERLKSVVLETILQECPEPSFVDPRPTLCEAWFLSLIRVANLIESSAKHIAGSDSTRTLLADSCCVAVLLLLRVPLRRDRKSSPDHLGMSLDGPQTRAMLSFLESYFRLGPDALRAVAVSLRYRVDVDIESLDSSQGVGILVASLLRAASGGLPPWAIEVIPSLYSSLYIGCGNDAEIFCRMMQLSMTIRLSKSLNAFGAILPGELLAGRYFENIREASKAALIETARDACRSNDAEGWRKFKVALKQACGGKKKSSLSLKPSFTTWDIDRI